MIVAIPLAVTYLESHVFRAEVPSPERELALLRLVGGTPAQVRSMARWEAGLVVVMGVGIGAAISLVTLMPASSVITGSPVPYAPLGLVALVFGSAAAVGFLGSQIATRLAMRSRPVEAIGLRE